MLRWTILCRLQVQNLATWHCRVQHKSMLRLSILQTQSNNRKGWIRMTLRWLQCSPILYYNAERRMRQCREKTRKHLWKPNAHIVAEAHACSTCLGVKTTRHLFHQEAARTTYLHNMWIFHHPCVILSLGHAASWIFARPYKYFLSSPLLELCNNGSVSPKWCPHVLLTP